MIRRLFFAMFMALCCGVGYAAAEESNDPLSFTKGNTSVKFGGFVTLTIGKYLEGATSRGNDFPTSQIEMDCEAADENKLLFDPTSTRLFFKMSQKTASMGDIKLYVEGNFRGDGNTFFLRIATVDFLGFTVGQTWSNMVDAASIAPTVDIQGVNSRTFFRTPQIAYRHTVGKSWLIGGAVEYPTINYTSYSTSYTEPEIRTPDFLLFTQVKGGAGHLKATGVLRTLPYSDNSEVATKIGWGAQLSGSLNVTKALTLYSQAIYGESIGKYINDITYLAFDVVESETSREAGGVPMYGASLGMKYKLSPKFDFTANISRSCLELDDSDYTDIDSTYKTGRYISTTLFYYPIRSMTVGFEYLNGTCETQDDSFARAQRLNMMVRYFF